MDNIIRLTYNPYNKKLLICSGSHAEALQKVNFNEYIRFVIIDNILYVRAFYPFVNDGYIETQKILKASSELLSLYKKEYIKVLKDAGYIFDDIIINADADLKKQLDILN